MTEAEFWTELEYRVSLELSQLPDDHVRFLWCDGFLPDYDQPDDRFVVGYALISEDDGRSFERYRFRLTVNPDTRESQNRNWSAMLSEGLSRGRWLFIDRDRKLLEVQCVPEGP